MEVQCQVKARIPYERSDDNEQPKLKFIGGHHAWVSGHHTMARSGHWARKQIARAYLMSLQSSRFFVSLSFFFSVIISGILHDGLRKSWSCSGGTQLVVSRWNLRPWSCASALTRCIWWWLIGIFCCCCCCCLGSGALAWATGWLAAVGAPYRTPKCLRRFVVGRSTSAEPLPVRAVCC